MVATTTKFTRASLNQNAEKLEAHPVFGTLRVKPRVATTSASSVEKFGSIVHQIFEFLVSSVTPTATANVQVSSRVSIHYSFIWLFYF